MARHRGATSSPWRIGRGPSRSRYVAHHRSPLRWYNPFSLASAAWQVLLWAVLLISVTLLSVMVVVPRVAGATPYTILTGSMAGTYDPGSLVVVKPVPFESIGIGDPITFQLESGQAGVVTHRVIGTTYAQDGSRRLITQGDANTAVDQDTVRAVQVRGKVWYAVPELGRLNLLLSGTQHQALVLLAAGLLIAYAAFLLASASLTRLRGRRR